MNDERTLAHGDQRVVVALNDENAYWKSPHARMDHIAYRCWLANERLTMELDECEICQSPFSDVDPGVLYTNGDGTLVVHRTCGDGVGFQEVDYIE